MNRRKEEEIEKNSRVSFFRRNYFLEVAFCRFVVKDRVTSYSSSQRSLVVMQILLRVKFDETDRVGIRRLLNDNTYLACFPLHEGRWERSQSDGKILDRRV